MKTIISNATTTLFNMLDNLSESPHESWQCVYLKPVAANDVLNAPLNFENAKIIVAQLSKIKGTAYLCEDGDIIILTQCTAQQVVGKLSAFLGDIGPSIPIGQHMHNLFGVFDLGKHWQGFYSLCVNKYLKIIARSEEHRMQAPSAHLSKPMLPVSLTYPMAAAN